MELLKEFFDRLTFGLRRLSGKLTPREKILALILFSLTAAGLTTGQITNKPYIIFDINNYSTLSSALSTIGSTNCTFVVPMGTSCAGGRVTIPKNINLRIERGGVITIANGTTFTINGTLEAGPWQIFSCSGTGKVLFGANPSGGAISLLPEWWGAKGDGATDDTTAINAMLSALGNAGNGVPVNYVFQPGSTYVVSGNGMYQTMPGAVLPAQRVKFVGNGATIKAKDHTVTQLMYFSPYTDAGTCEISDFRFRGPLCDLISGGRSQVWAYNSALSKPTTVTYDGTTIAEKSSVEALAAAGDWYWDSSNGTFYILTPNYGVLLPGDGHTIVVNGTTLSNTWTAYIPVNGFVTTGGSGWNVHLHHCKFEALNIAIQNLGIEHFVAEHCSGEVMNTAVLGQYQGTNCYESKIVDCVFNTMYGANCIQWGSNAAGDGQLMFEQLDVEVFAGRFAYLNNCCGVIFQNCRHELDGCFRGTATELVRLDNCFNIQFRGCGVGAGNSGISTYFHPQTRYFYLNNVRGLDVDGCNINTDWSYPAGQWASLYEQAPGSVNSGINFHDCYFLEARLITDLINGYWPIATFTNNVYLFNSHPPSIVFSTGLLGKRSGLGGREWSQNVDFSGSISHTDAYCVGAQDTSASCGIDDSYAFKITWSGCAHQNTTLTNQINIPSWSSSTVRPALFSFWVRSDAACHLSIFAGAINNCFIVQAVDQCQGTKWVAAAGSGATVTDQVSSAPPNAPSGITKCVKVQAPASPKANTRYAYSPLGGTYNYSNDLQISLWVYVSSATTANNWQIALCSDAAGATPVNTFKLPAISSTGTWVPVAVTWPGTSTTPFLSSSIQSVALYSGSSAPTGSMSIYLCDINATNTVNHGQCAAIPVPAQPTSDTGGETWLHVQVPIPNIGYSGLSTIQFYAPDAPAGANLWIDKLRFETFSNCAEAYAAVGKIRD